MGEVIEENGKMLKVNFVCATAVHSQLFSFADLLSTTSLIKLGSVFALHVVKIVEGGGIVGPYENNDLVLPCNKLS